MKKETPIQILEGPYAGRWAVRVTGLKWRGLNVSKWRFFSSRSAALSFYRRKP